MSAAVRFLRNDVLLSVLPGGHELRRRILFVDAESVMLFDIDYRKAVPERELVQNVVAGLQTGVLRVATVDPSPPDRRPDDHLSERRRNDRDHWLSVIAPVAFKQNGELDPALYDPFLRVELIKEMAAAADTTSNVIWKWLRRWWRHGQEAAGLLSGFDRSGGRGKRKGSVTGRKRGRPRIYVILSQPGLNVGEWERSRLTSGGLRFHQRRGMSLPNAYQATIETYFRRPGKEGIEVRAGVPVPILLPPERIPTFDQFLYWYGQVRNARAEYKAKHGEKSALLKRDSKPGTFRGQVPGPGHTYIIDATIGDIYLLSSVEPGRVIGRPVSYFVVDAFSLMIVGVYVGLEGPSWTGAKLALESAFCDKAAFLKQHGFDPLTDLWPCSGFPHFITADRGELLGKAADHAVRAFEMHIGNCPAYRPDLKALVEGQFKLADDRVIHWQPGAVYKARDRGDPDYRYDATYTLESFTRLMILYVMRHNNAQPLRDWVPASFPILPEGDPTPLDLWDWGMDNHTAQMRRHHEDVEQDRDWTRINLMRESEATVSRDGVRLLGLDYWSDELQAMGWFDRAAVRGRPQKVMVAYYERDVTRAWLRLENGRRIEVLSLKEAFETFVGKRLHEVQDYLHRRKEASVTGRHTEAQRAAEFNAREAAILREANQEREAVLAGAKPVVKGIREARATQRQADASRDTADYGNGASAAPQGMDVLSAAPPSKTPGAYIPPPSDFDLL